MVVSTDIHLGQEYQRNYRSLGCGFHYKEVTKTYADQALAAY